MKKFYIGLALTSLTLTAAQAAPIYKAFGQKVNGSHSTLFVKNSLTQQNLIGEVAAVDASAGRIAVKTQTGSVNVTTGDKTTFRRVPPGQTSLANAETIAMADIKVGDRILIPGGAADEQTPVRQVIIMAREAISAQRSQEAERRRARTTVGRITAINLEKKEITVQSRRRANPQAGERGNPQPGAPETLTVAAAENVKLLRYAPDSLRIADAQAGSFADLRVGDQVRVVGDRSADNARITAEEIVSGSVTRAVGSIVEVNAERGEIVVKNSQSGQTMTVVVGKNTLLRRIPAEAAETFRQRAAEREQRRRERASRQAEGGATQAQQQPGQTGERRNRRENRNGENRNGEGRRQGGGGGLGQFENFPAITVAELKKGDAVLITGTGGADNSRVTAASIVTGGAEMQQFFQRTQGGGRGNPQSPGLPGNVGGGNQANDRDEPRNQ